MTDFLIDNYLWMKAWHIVSVICWMAVLLYAPRLFVYHCDAETGSVQSETFKVMERRLIRIIGNIAMCASWLFGGLMLWANPDLFSQGWMHLKLTAIILMTGFHHVLVRWYKGFAADENKHSPKFYRYMNELPTVLMIIIVLMAVAKPF